MDIFAVSLFPPLHPPLVPILPSSSVPHVVTHHAPIILSPAFFDPSFPVLSWPAARRPVLLRPHIFSIRGYSGFRHAGDFLHLAARVHNLVLLALRFPLTPGISPGLNHTPLIASPSPDLRSRFPLLWALSPLLRLPDTQHLCRYRFFTSVFAGRFSVLDAILASFGPFCTCLFDHLCGDPSQPGSIFHSFPKAPHWKYCRSLGAPFTSSSPDQAAFPPTPGLLLLAIQCLLFGLRWRCFFPASQSPRLLTVYLHRMDPSFFFPPLFPVFFCGLILPQMRRLRLLHKSLNLLASCASPYCVAALVPLRAFILLFISHSLVALSAARFSPISSHFLSPPLSP